MKKVKKDHRDFEVKFSWGLNGQYNETIVFRSTNKSTPLLSVIKRIGGAYFRCKVQALNIVHSGSIRTNVKEFNGIEPIGYMGTNFEAINKLIKQIKPKYKNLL
jgi:hypothetical protein